MRTSALLHGIFWFLPQNYFAFIFGYFGLQSNSFYSKVRFSEYTLSILHQLRPPGFDSVHSLLSQGYCSAALLTLVTRMLLKNHVITLELTGPLLTLAAIFGMLTGGVTICSILEARLRETAS